MGYSEYSHGVPPSGGVPFSCVVSSVARRMPHAVSCMLPQCCAWHRSYGARCTCRDDFCAATSSSSVRCRTLPSSTPICRDDTQRATDNMARAHTTRAACAAAATPTRHWVRPSSVSHKVSHSHARGTQARAWPQHIRVADRSTARRRCATPRRGRTSSTVPAYLLTRRLCASSRATASLIVAHARSSSAFRTPTCKSIARQSHIRCTVSGVC